MSFALLTVIVVFSGSSRAQEMSPFDFFDKQCLHSGPDFDRTVEAAARAQWPELSRDVLAVLAPLQDPTDVRGWIASSETEHMQVVVATRRTSADGVGDACTVGLSNIDTDAFETAVKIRIGFDPQGEERDAERKYQKFLTITGGRQRLVTLSLPLVPNRQGEVLASVIEVW